MKKPFTIKCPAKVNLSLDVVGRRPDGYHNLEMIMHTIRLFDTLTVTAYPASSTEIRISTNLGFLPIDDKNLCAKATRLFFEETKLFAKVNIELRKRIPVGAGLGGGSSDAAGTLLALNHLMGDPLSKEMLAHLAQKIGADVPFFIYGGCMLAQGIGEILSPLPTLKDKTFLIAKPKYGISTPFVYKNLVLDESTPHPDTNEAILALKQNDAKLLGKYAGNVLETVVTKNYPEIAQYKAIMNSFGAAYSLMSGSGSAVFGIFDDPKYAELAKQKLKDLTKQVYIA